MSGKEPNRPKKPYSAFILFITEEKAKLKDSGLKTTEISRRV